MLLFPDRSGVWLKGLSLNLMVVKKINAFHCPDIVWLDTHLVPRLLTGHRLVVHRCMCIVCTGMGLRFQNTLLLEKG